MAVKERRARGVPADGEVRSPLSTILITSGCCLLIAGGAIAAAVWNRLTPDVYADWLTDTIAVIASLFCLYCVASVIRGRTVLHADRVELVDVFRRKTVRRDQIVGYRIGRGFIVLCRRAGAGRNVSVTAEVVQSPAWVAWLESLPNLDEQDAVNAQATLEADPRLGHTPGQRRAGAERMAKWAGWLNLLGMALAGWAMFWPHPYAVAVLVCGLMPVVALTLLARWRGLFSMIEEARGPSLNTFWLTPGLAVGIRGMVDVQMIDWHAPLLTAAGIAAVFTALVWWLDVRGRGVLGMIVPFLVGLAWAWGGVVTADVLLDFAKPQRIPARVVEVSGKADDPSVTLEALAPPHERFEDFDTPRPLPGVAKVGTRTCVVVYPGRFGWRYGWVGRCKP